MNQRIMVNVVGGGLAGCEAALQLANHGVCVKLFEAKPLWRSAAHKSNGLAEIVCSNSFKSTVETTAGGTLKNELNKLDCRLINIAYDCAVPAGSALAVDREEFSKRVTDAIYSHPNITVVNAIVDKINVEEFTIICGGPVCHDGLANELIRLTGENSLSFFDAAAPIVTAESIDMSRAFFGARYGKGGDDYLNCPMTREEYLAFYEELIKAERVIDEVGGVFEGCMPVEVMAARGVDSLRYGPLRPVGFNSAGKPYAVLQLRRENTDATLFNLVGFQTNLKFGEQKRVFSMIPALRTAEFVRYGVMHRNTFIDAPKVINADLSLKKYPNVYIAGQLSGVEGYVESIATGLLAAINVIRRIENKKSLLPPKETIIGALCNYITTPNSNFQPMNSNFGILPQIDGKKDDRKRRYYERSNVAINEFVSALKND